MAHPVLVNLGVWRSGTTFSSNALASAFAGRAHVLHEDITHKAAMLDEYFRCYEGDRIKMAAQEPTIGAWLERVSQLAESRPVVVLGVTTAHLAPVLLDLFGPRLRTIHMHRHPVNVAAAMYIGNWSFAWDGKRAHEPDWAGVVLTPGNPWARYPQIESRWAQLGPFARILYNWLELTSAAIEFSEKFPDVPHRLLAAETDVFGSDRYIHAVAELINTEPSPIARPTAINRNSLWSRAVEERPLGDAWKQIRDLPEVVEFARLLGYRFDQPELQERTSKYQLPRSIGAQIRHRTGYWQLRRRVVDHLRSKSVIPQAASIPGGGEPRPTWRALVEVLRTWLGSPAKPNNR